MREFLLGGLPTRHLRPLDVRLQGYRRAYVTGNITLMASNDPPKRNRPRLKEVAQLAGVSTMTVTRALHTPHKVAAATRARIEEIVSDVGYTPDLTARGLTLQRTGLVGSVVPLLTNSLIAEIVQGLSDAVASNGYQLLVGATGFSAPGEEAMVRAFLSRRVDA
ncbi:MAG: LacI family DNA-binding transcriptional regulator, partial [Casimicrobiaceae bacterium]